LELFVDCPRIMNHYEMSAVPLAEGTDRGQSTLSPECSEDWISEDNPVRVLQWRAA
jgi:hypothetical protein